MRAVLIVLLFALAIYSVLDCARTPGEDMPARLPKPMWLLIILALTGVGPIAWIITSRVKAAEERGGVVEPKLWSSREAVEFRRPERPRPLGPDDDPEFLRSLERDIRRRRRDEAEGDDGASPSSPSAP
ncbi:PLD nuclease N-terminal domain-containing protein [Actinomyces marmotae]|uniref:Cardiolipin synthase N-terminal domain-containing protein n=1 Tax=Actinomyces marmotae TaxID=2737173 RepID=A0A6M8B7A0_9ACTO|nr:PLD nuclease N-terminal domain-containing protein [Actinomyces marmotae]QKD79113.1 hypothetical protein HPC72_01535 [Actinomyces marmotae]